MVTVQFTPFSSTVSPAFWHALVKLKLDVLKLEQETLPVSASYGAGRTVTDRETGAAVALPSSVTLAEDAFSQESTPHLPPGSTLAVGKFKNFNTIEDFKNADKQALFNEMWDALTKPDADPDSILSQFLLITFADLKKYKFYYWFAFPAFVAKPAWDIAENGWVSGAEKLTPPLKGLPAFFLVRPGSDGKMETAPVTQYPTFFANVHPEQRTIGFLDPSSLPQNPGWPLRNLLAYLSHLDNSSASGTPLSFNVLCWRDTELPRSGQEWRSRYGTVTQVAASEPAARPSATGWERNAAGKLGPRLADLAPMMDPTHLAEQAVDLNLKLMRWRILPALDLERVAETKCLLLGAGTLGCFVARALMAWGVRNITLLDSGKVSFSNPVRQPLFEFDDCLDGGKPKAEAAAAALKRIFPGVNAVGHSLSIPMPGHPIPASPPSLAEQAQADVKKLEQLIDEHDVVFLLMDSRESRWLPTMLGKAKGKIVVNAALGFDSFVVMRHGARSTDGSLSKLGCYYCNDVVAPADSLTDRTLDQMCTVTRPGLASIASSNAVELLVSLLQHPLRNNAPAPPPPGAPAHNDPATLPPHESILGLIPHQLRGSLAQFNNVLITGAAYERCTACSEKVIKEYETSGFDMLLRAFNDPDYLERLTGLDKLKAETDAMLEGVEWVGENGEGGDDEDDF
ncbi:E1-like protein-activating [Clavulina sp. PMI_390]|nr:E1-like protein-activating [Clavulina sp. PMI_390]